MLFYAFNLLMAFDRLLLKGLLTYLLTYLLIFSWKIASVASLHVHVVVVSHLEMKRKDGTIWMEVDVVCIICLLRLRLQLFTELLCFHTFIRVLILFTNQRSYIWEKFVRSMKQDVISGILLFMKWWNIVEILKVQRLWFVLWRTWKLGYETFGWRCCEAFHASTRQSNSHLGFLALCRNSSGCDGEI